MPLCCSKNIRLLLLSPRFLHALCQYKNIWLVSPRTSCVPLQLKSYLLTGFNFAPFGRPASGIHTGTYCTYSTFANQNRRKAACPINFQPPLLDISLVYKKHVYIFLRNNTKIIPSVSSSISYYYYAYVYETKYIMRRTSLRSRIAPLPEASMDNIQQNGKHCSNIPTTSARSILCCFYLCTVKGTTWARRCTRSTACRWWTTATSLATPSTSPRCDHAVAAIGCSLFHCCLSNYY